MPSIPQFFRPLGITELKRMLQTQAREFPSCFLMEEERLFYQDESAAENIALQFALSDVDNFCGFVTSAQLTDPTAAEPLLQTKNSDGFSIQDDDLVTFNAQIDSPIQVLSVFCGDKFIPEELSIPGVTVATHEDQATKFAALFHEKEAEWQGILAENKIAFVCNARWWVKTGMLPQDIVANMAIEYRQAFPWITIPL